jgi:hypothetical protein
VMVAGGRGAANALAKLFQVKILHRNQYGT